MSVTELPFPRRPEPTGPAVAGAARAADATGSRWQPHRAGILNVWRYYDETFTFHQGRLLLRGQNGSGKSKALELLLPFLFDASLRPNRLSTFGGSERTMHWNLLGEGASGKTRVGYVWMEFRRVGDDGTERWFGCGARLQASVHTSAVHADYFTTAPGSPARRCAPRQRGGTTTDPGRPRRSPARPRRHPCLGRRLPHGRTP